jgi:hypothetical protein
VVVIDGATDTVTATVRTGHNTGAVAVDPATDTVFASAGDTGILGSMGAIELSDIGCSRIARCGAGLSRRRAAWPGAASSSMATRPASRSSSGRPNVATSRHGDGPGHVLTPEIPC